MSTQKSDDLTRKGNLRAAKILAERIAQTASKHGLHISIDEIRIEYVELPGQAWLNVTISESGRRGQC